MEFDHESRWPAFRALAESGETDEMLSQIKRVDDPAERISLYRFVIRQMAFTEWQNKNLDVMIALADAAVEDCELLGGDYLQQANLILYNTSANLADCWDNGFPHERRHFEKGLAYARKALWYREHFGKPAHSHALAWWAIGKHELSLGQREEALASFRKSMQFEEEAATAEGKPAAIDPAAPAGYLIACGYIALMEQDRDSLAKLQRVLDEMLAQGGEPREEAEIILEQLEVTAKNEGVEW